jgi:hypothetical protein
MSEKGTAPTGNTEYDLHDITPQEVSVCIHTETNTAFLAHLWEDDEKRIVAKSSLYLEFAGTDRKQGAGFDREDQVMRASSITFLCREGTTDRAGHRRFFRHSQVDGREGGQMITLSEAMRRLHDDIVLHMLDARREKICVEQGEEDGVHS